MWRSVGGFGTMKCEPKPCWPNPCSVTTDFFAFCVLCACEEESVSERAGTERAASYIVYTTRWAKSEYMNFVFRKKGEQYPWLATEWSRHSVWPEHETVIISFHKKMKRQALLYIYIYIYIYCRSGHGRSPFVCILTMYVTGKAGERRGHIWWWWKEGEDWCGSDDRADGGGIRILE